MTDAATLLALAGWGTMTEVRKGYCQGCPFDYGKPETEMAYNLGCLPSIGEIAAACGENTAWACHSEPNKICCGHADRRTFPLFHMAGVHSDTHGRAAQAPSVAAGDGK